MRVIKQASNSNSDVNLYLSFYRGVREKQKQDVRNQNVTTNLTRTRTATRTKQVNIPIEKRIATVHTYTTKCLGVKTDKRDIRKQLLAKTFES